VGISGAPGDLAHDDQCGMEEVLQHTLRICRCNAAMMSADANMNSSLCFDDASRERIRTLAMRVAQLESESRREKEVRCRPPAAQPSPPSRAQPTF